MRKIKSWLANNKILFETVAATMLSIMAIIVAAAQSCTASRQTRLMSLQTKIAEAQALPQFELVEHPLLNDSTGKFDDYYLVVSNRGGPIHDFDAESAYFLAVTRGGASSDDSLVIPINGYFTASFITAHGTGDLVTMRGFRNNGIVTRLAQETSDSAHARGLPYALVGERLFLRLRYKDLLDRYHEEFYSLNPVTGGTRISEHVGRAAFSNWHDARPVELLELTPAILLAPVTRPH